MRNFLAAVLSVIAVGVLLIAYGLLAPRAIAAPSDNAYYANGGGPGGIITLDPNRYPANAAPAYASERVVYVTPAPRRIATVNRVIAGRMRSCPRAS